MKIIESLSLKIYYHHGMKRHIVLRGPSLVRVYNIIAFYFSAKNMGILQSTLFLYISYKFFIVNVSIIIFLVIAFFDMAILKAIFQNILFHLFFVISRS